jgi:hypothetical protein
MWWSKDGRGELLVGVGVGGRGGRNLLCNWREPSKSNDTLKSKKQRGR